MDKTRNDHLTESLESTGIVEVIAIKEREVLSGEAKQLIIHMRVSSFVKAQQLSGALLDEAARSEWSVLSTLQHIRQDKRDVFVPTLHLQAADLDAACRDVCRVLDIAALNKQAFEGRVSKPAPASAVTGGVVQVDRGGSPITGVRLKSYPLGMREGRNVKNEVGRGVAAVKVGR